MITSNFVQISLGIGLSRTLRSPDPFGSIKKDVQEIKECVAQSQWSGILLHVFWTLWQKNTSVPGLYDMKDTLQELNTSGLPLDALVVGCMNTELNGVLRLLEPLTEPSIAQWYQAYRPK